MTRETVLCRVPRAAADAAGIDTRPGGRASRPVSAVADFAVRPDRRSAEAYASALESGIQRNGAFDHDGIREIMTPELAAFAVDGAARGGRPAGRAQEDSARAAARPSRYGRT